ncbi:hypothetical protein SDC9_155080 [bioreactor metagenome]|uniref:Uncharacterized protein n=1 Tax=bioreactor metagenome TaxID=1076179 RepID=A0A645F0G6_9ZZZZ
MLDAPTFYGGGNLLEITSRVPATATVATSAAATTSGDSVPPLLTEACEQDPRPGQTFRTLLNIATGMEPRTRTMDTNGDGRVTPDDALASRATTARHELRLPSSTGAQTREGSDGRTDHLEAPPTRMVRPSWRQLQ